MRRLTIEDCEHLLAARAGAFEVDRVLEGGEETIGQNGVMLEVIRQLRDALHALRPMNEVEAKSAYEGDDIIAARREELLRAGRAPGARSREVGAELVRTALERPAWPVPKDAAPTPECPHETMVNPTGGRGWQCLKCGAPVSPLDPFRKW